MCIDRLVSGVGFCLTLDLKAAQRQESDTTGDISLQRSAFSSLPEKLIRTSVVLTTLAALSPNSATSESGRPDTASVPTLSSRGTVYLNGEGATGFAECGAFRQLNGPPARTRCSADLGIVG